MKLRILAEAETEIDAARRFLNAQSAGLGSRFLAELSSTFDAIVSRPLRHARLETIPADRPYRRARLAKFPYVVVFEIVDQEIVVLAVAHASRKPNYWLDRLEP